MTARVNGEIYSSVGPREDKRDKYIFYYDLLQRIAWPLTRKYSVDVGQLPILFGVARSKVAVQGEIGRDPDGVITVRSAPGEGTTPCIYLPRFDQAEPDHVEESISLETLQSNESVLLVEDQADLLGLVKEKLEECGCKVVAVLKAEEALYRLRAREETTQSPLLLKQPPWLAFPNSSNLHLPCIN